jgi:3'(2'), 5'-bisphosphate nucleotidase
MNENADVAAFQEAALLHALTNLALEAAAAINAISSPNIDVREKSDRSPVTAADYTSEAIILAGLKSLLPQVPIISEEQAAAGWQLPRASTFVLVDPLDGTREFLAGRDEFTVNIAIVVDGTPVVGVLVAPALGIVWRGVVGRGAERLQANAATPIRTRPWPSSNAVALVSRSHLDAQSEKFVRQLGAVQRPCGSALKFCRLAEGGADVYPRLAPTSAWDVAAGQALLAAAGGAVFTPAGVRLTYGGEDSGFLVPAFIACGDPAILSRLLALR